MGRWWAQCGRPVQAAAGGRHAPAQSLGAPAPSGGHEPPSGTVTSVHTARQPAAPTDLSAIINLPTTMTPTRERISHTDDVPLSPMKSMEGEIFLWL